MNAFSNPFDSPDAVRARDMQADPLIMYIIVRRETKVTLAGLAEAVARGVLACADKFECQTAHAGHFADWRTTSFRKVVLRANERDWSKLLAQETVVTSKDRSGEDVIAVMPPFPKSAVSVLVRGLQAYTLSLSELEPGFWDVGSVLPPSILLAANPNIEMSAGKLLAQVGHAAMMVIDAPVHLGAGESWSRALVYWRAMGCRFAFVPSTSTGWAAALATLPCVVVTDSGLTEVAPGSRTVIALRPASDNERASFARCLDGD
jgi:peptidyl-tRNA hydrolase